MSRFPSVILIVVSVLFGCAGSRVTEVRQGPQDAGAIHAAGVAMNQNAINSVSEAEEAAREALVVLDLIIAEEAAKAGGIDKIPADWAVWRDLYRGQHDWLVAFGNRCAGANQVVEPQLGGVMAELAQLARAQATFWLSLHRGGTDIQREMLELRRKQPEPWAPVTLSNRSPAGRSYVLGQALRRSTIYAQMLANIIEARGEQPDSMFWRSLARVAALQSRLFGREYSQLQSGVVIPDAEIAAAAAVGNATSWQITQRLHETFPIVRQGYQTLSAADFAVMQGADHFDADAYATFRNWFTAKAGNQAAEIQPVMVRTLWSAFREQDSRAFTGPGEGVVRAVATQEDRALLTKRDPEPSQEQAQGG